jgi:hypothetical protein
MGIFQLLMKLARKQVNILTATDIDYGFTCRKFQIKVSTHLELNQNKHPIKLRRTGWDSILIKKRIGLKGKGFGRLTA